MVWEKIFISGGEIKGRSWKSGWEGGVREGGEINALKKIGKKTRKSW